MLSADIKNSILFRYLLIYLFSNKRGWTWKKVVKEKVRSLAPGMIDSFRSQIKRTGGTRR